MFYRLNTEIESTKTRGLGVPLTALLILCAVLLTGFLIYMLSRYLYARHLDRVVAGKERNVHTHVVDPHTVGKILFAVFTIALLAWSMVTIVKLKSDMADMKEELEERIRFLEESQDEEKLGGQKEYSLLQSCDYRFVKIDPEENMVEVLFEIVPKNVSAEMILSISWEGETVVLSETEGIYQGKMTVPGFQYTDAYPVLTMKHGDTIETEALSTTVSGYPAEKCFLELLPEEYKLSMEPTRDGELVINGNVRMDRENDKLADDLVRKKELVLYAEGEELKRTPLSLEDTSETADVSGVYEVREDLKLRMVLEIETDCGWIVTIPVATVNTDDSNALLTGETMTVRDASGEILFETMV